MQQIFIFIEAMFKDMCNAFRPRYRWLAVEDIPTNISSQEYHNSNN